MYIVQLQLYFTLSTFSNSKKQTTALNYHYMRYVLCDVQSCAISIRHSRIHFFFQIEIF